MTTHLRITIDRGPEAKHEECAAPRKNGCVFADLKADGYRCRLFNADIWATDWTTQRCPECLAAEVTDGYVQSA